MMNSPILFRQNALIKLVYVIFQTFIISFSNLNFFLFITIFNLIFFLILQPSILKKWLFTILKLLPLFISILVFSILFASPFLQQLYLLGRISLILLLSVFLVKTTNIQTFIADTAFMNKYKLTSDIRFFFVAVIFFVPELIEQFKQISTRKLSLSAIIELFERSLLSIQKVEKKAELSETDQAQNFDYASNSILIFSILLITISFYKDFSCVI